MEFSEGTLIQITSDSMGSGSADLGGLLLSNYLKIISEDECNVKIITFYNSGVKLLSKNSDCFEHLARLEQNGIKLLACKTCVNFFELAGELDIGTVGTMHDIISLHKVASKIVNL